VTVTPETAFEIGGSGAIVPAGGSVNTWTIQPKAGLEAGEYTAEIMVIYNGTATTGATSEVRFTVEPAAEDNEDNDVIIWAESPNQHFGLNLSKEIITERTPDGDIPVAVLSFQTTNIKNNKTGNWTAVNTAKQIFSGVPPAGIRRITLPALIQRGFIDLRISTAALDSGNPDKDLRRLPLGGAEGEHIIHFNAQVSARARFGAGTKYVVDYSPALNNNSDLWTLAEKGQTVIPADFLNTVEVYLVDSANKKDRTARPWTMFDDLQTAGEIPESADMTAAIRIIRPFPDSGKAARDQIAVRTIAQKLPDTAAGKPAYAPASREQRYNISGHGKPMYNAGKEPAPKANAPLVLNLKKGFEIIDIDDTGTANRFTVKNKPHYIFTLTDKGVTFIPGAAAITGDTDDNSITVRAAATARRPASAPNVIPVTLPAETSLG
jgi:hypothetical protein